PPAHTPPGTPGPASAAPGGAHARPRRASARSRPFLPELRRRHAHCTFYATARHRRAFRRPATPGPPSKSTDLTLMPNSGRCVFVCLCADLDITYGRGDRQVILVAGLASAPNAMDSY